MYPAYEHLREGQTLPARQRLLHLVPRHALRLGHPFLEFLRHEGRGSLSLFLSDPRTKGRQDKRSCPGRLRNAGTEKKVPREVCPSPPCSRTREGGVAASAALCYDGRAEHGARHGKNARNPPSRRRSAGFSGAFAARGGCSRKSPGHPYEVGRARPPRVQTPPGARRVARPGVFFRRVLPGGRRRRGRGTVGDPRRRFAAGARGASGSGRDPDLRQSPLLRRRRHAFRARRPDRLRRRRPRTPPPGAAGREGVRPDGRGEHRLLRRATPSRAWLPGLRLRSVFRWRGLEPKAPRSLPAAEKAGGTFAGPFARRRTTPGVSGSRGSRPRCGGFPDEVAHEADG